MNTRSVFFLIVVCAILYVLSYFHRVTPAILSSDLVVDFDISAGKLGLFSSATLLAFAIMQLPSGMFTDLLGGRRVLAGLCLITAAGTIWFANSTTLYGAFAARFVTGVGTAVTVPIVAVMARWCPPRYFVRATALVFGMAGLGGLLAAPPLHYFNSLWGWRHTMDGFGVLSVVMALLVIFFIPGGENDRSGSSSGFWFVIVAIGNVLKSRIFWTLGLWYMMICGASFCMSTLWWGPYLMAGLGLSRLAAATVVSGISIGVMCSFFFLGATAGTIFRNLKAVLAVCTILSILSLGLLFLAHGQIPVWGVTIAAAIFTGCSSAIGPITYSFIKDAFPLAIAGTAVGLVNMTYPLWSSVLQGIYGQVLEKCEPFNGTLAPHQLALGIIVINCCVAMIFLILFMRQTGTRVAETP